MELTPLTALSPLDGRYAENLKNLRHDLSEFAFFRYRVIVELKWLEALADCKALTEVAPFNDSAKQLITQIISNFGMADAHRIKIIEQTTHHDLKAVEYYLREKLEPHPQLKKAIEFIHFACTSDDINNLAYALMLKTAREKHLLPTMTQLIDALTAMAHAHAAIPMLARTHGQPATPTTLGKEIANIANRLRLLSQRLANIHIHGKCNGTVGNFNAHYFVYPEVDWQTLSQQFVEKLGLHYTAYTTQIEPHDYMVEFCNVLTHFNHVLIDFNRDIWGYISLGYFKQKASAESVGSSVMPHKINPIHFENAEGNLGIANAVLQHLAHHLPISRFQRDLTDSTRLRNLSVGMGHSILAYQATVTGLQQLVVDTEIIAKDLDNHWEVLAEAIQTLLRRHGTLQAYEKIKALTRGRTMSQADFHELIDQINIPDKIKSQLKSLSVSTYLGIAKKLAEGI